MEPKMHWRVPAIRPAALALSIFFTLASPSYAREGGQDAGGGDPRKAEDALLLRRQEEEFQRTAAVILKEIDAAGIRQEDLGYSLDSLRDAVASAKPYASANPQEGMRLKGKKVGAINSAYHKSIAFSSVQWGLLSTPDQKRAFVLHEYLRMVKDLGGKPLDDSGYAYSSRTLALLAAPKAERKFCWMNYNDLLAKIRGSANVYFAAGAEETSVRKDVRGQCWSENGRDKGYCDEIYSPMSCIAAQDLGLRLECSFRPHLGDSLLRGVGNNASEAMIRLRKTCYAKYGPTACNVWAANAPCRFLSADEIELLEESKP